MDPTCVLSAVLFFSGNTLLTIYGLMEFNKRSGDFISFQELDPEYIEDMWHFRREWRKLEISAGLINAVAWFLFCIPIIQLAWILSLGGRRGIWIHTTMAGLALGSCFSEFLCRLYYIGVVHVTEWLSMSMNLDDWIDVNDKIGWRVLEIANLVASGMIVWVDAFEWLCLFFIMTLIYFSTRSLVCGGPGTARVNFTFGRCWAHLGLFIGFLSLFDFAANVLRFESWRLFQDLAMFFSIFNRLILMPIWLCLFGNQLSIATKSVELTNMFSNPTPPPAYRDHTNVSGVPAESAPVGGHDDLTKSPMGPVS